MLSVERQKKILRGLGLVEAEHIVTVNNKTIDGESFWCKDAKSDDERTLIILAVNEDEFPKRSSSALRVICEEIALAYLKQHEDLLIGEIQFAIVDLVVFKENYAMVRKHYLNRD